MRPDTAKRTLFDGSVRHCLCVVPHPVAAEGLTRADSLSGHFLYRAAADTLSLYRECPSAVSVRRGKGSAAGRRGGRAAVRTEASMSAKSKARRSGPRPDDGLLLGLAGCIRARGTGRTCDGCGTLPGVLPVPLRARGQFCPACCPCCNGGQNTPQSDGRAHRAFDPWRVKGPGGPRTEMLL